MRRQKELNEQTLEKARKEKERVLFLQAKIKKAEQEIERIRDENRWMRYLTDDFDKNATEEQKVEFFNKFDVIK